MWKMTDQLKIIVVDINSLRFSLEKLIAADMNNQDNVLAVYNELERATTLFNDFHIQQQKLRLGIDKVYYKIKSSLFLFALCYLFWPLLSGVYSVSYKYIE